MINAILFPGAGRVNLVPTTSASIDYSILYPFFSNLFIIKSDTTFANLAGSSSIQPLEPVKNIIDLLDTGTRVLWTSNDEVRQTYLLPKWGASYDLSRPLYNSPDGDIAHMTMPNVVDVLLRKDVTTNNAPNTKVIVARIRNAVLDENLSFGEGISYKENSDLTASIGNQNVQIKVSGSSLTTKDIWTAIMIEDNGASSRLFFNNVQNGATSNLTSGIYSIFGIGTVSHVMESDIVMVGNYKGLLSAGQRTSLQAAIESIFPIGLKPRKPFARNISISFDNVDTFTANYTYDDGGTGLAEDTALRTVEWFGLTPGTSPDGWTGLDAQKVVFNKGGLTLKRSNFPTFFPSGTLGTNASQIGARVKAYGVGAVSWSGVTLRSNTLNDNIVGTPTAPPPHLVTASIEDSNKSQIILTFLHGTGTINSATGNVNDFKVYVNEIEVSKSSITFPGGNVVNLNIVPTLVSTDSVRVQLIHGGTPLADNGGIVVEEFVTGPIIAFDNNIIGPVTVKMNLTKSNTTASPGWINLESDWNLLETLSANINDINGDPTGIAISIDDIFQGYGQNDVPQTSADIPDTEITRRGPSCWSGGQSQGGILLAGFTAGQRVDVQVYCQWSNSGRGTASISIIGTTTDTTAGLDTSTLTKVNSVTNAPSFTADASGNVRVKLNITTSGENMINAVIFTKYP